MTPGSLTANTSTFPENGVNQVVLSGNHLPTRAFHPEVILQAEVEVHFRRSNYMSFEATHGNKLKSNAEAEE